MGNRELNWNGHVHVVVKLNWYLMFSKMLFYCVYVTIVFTIS